MEGIGGVCFSMVQHGIRNENERREEKRREEKRREKDEGGFTLYITYLSSIQGRAGWPNDAL